VQQSARTAGVHRNTLTQWLKESLGDEELQARIKVSRDRHIKMLGQADLRLHTILESGGDDTALRAMAPIFRTFGVWEDQPKINITQLTPIQFRVNGDVHEVKIGDHAGSSSETS